MKERRKDNWTLLLKEYEKHIGGVYKDKYSGKKYYFIGLLHADDDYYYAMWDNPYIFLYSCAGSMETMGLKKLKAKKV